MWTGRTGTIRMVRKLLGQSVLGQNVTTNSPREKQRLAWRLEHIQTVIAASAEMRASVWVWVRGVHAPASCQKQLGPGLSKSPRETHPAGVGRIPLRDKWRLEVWKKQISVRFAAFPEPL